MRRDDDEEWTTDISGMAPAFVSEDPTGRIASSVRLMCVAGADLGRTFRILRTPIVIGRGSQVEISLRGPDVSRQHARLIGIGNEFVLEDMGSQNGTFINGTPVKAKSSIRVGDRLQFGSTIFVFAHHDELEDRMHQLQRLEAMGALAGGLAHDFNNALAVILGTLGLFERKLPPNSTELREMVAEMMSAATSASGLARRLLRLGRTEPLEFETVMLDAFLHKTAATMRRQLTGIEINVDVGTGLAVRGSQEELLQVLVNLMLNARDAMPSGGILRIYGREVAFDRAQAATHHLPTKGDYVELVVVDNGSGMDDVTLARAFEPFFTTKPAGQGTGLGLAMAYSVVRRHGGTIVAESAVGRGTTFRIWLPRTV